MKDFHKKIEIKIFEKIEILSYLYNDKGVQPSEIISKCVERQYRHYQLNKFDSYVCFEVCFLEDASLPVSNLCKMRYVYDEFMLLLGIQEVISNKAFIQWERRERIESVEKEISELIESTKDKKKLKEFKSFARSLEKEHKLPSLAELSIEKLPVAC
ncbi:MAG: hypothetical protein ACO1RX_20035 [Candidatus Sericytochromatia bacterium]